MKLAEVLTPEELLALGIVEWGYTEESQPRSFEHYSQWVDAGGHGILGYLADHRKDKRSDIKEYFPQFKSALVFLFSYQEQNLQQERFYSSPESNGLRMASYALSFEGMDYHHIIKERLGKIAELLKEKDHELEASLTLDIQPVLERDLAFRSGLGWFGKNSMLINREHGSFLILGSLLLSKSYQQEERKIETDHCGQCTACIDACPTDAIDGKKRTLLADKCISTWTIELFKNTNPPEGSAGRPEIFGCDICQNVCPWNKRLAKKYDQSELPNKTPVMDFFLTRPIEEIIADLLGMSNREFQRKFKGTALERTGRQGLLKNLLLAQKSLD